LSDNRGGEFLTSESFEVDQLIFEGGFAYKERDEIKSSFLPHTMDGILDGKETLSVEVQDALSRTSAKSSFLEARKRVMKTLGVEESAGVVLMTDSLREIGAKHPRKKESSIRRSDLFKPSSIEYSRCGSCCESFTLSLSHKSHAMVLEALSNGTSPIRIEVSNDDGTYGPETREVSFFEDLLNWFQNIVPIPLEEAWSRMLVSPGHYEASGINAYRCQLFVRDEETGLGECTIHEERPRVCREFRPYSDGGYLRSRGGNPYVECSYRIHHNEEQSEVYRHLLNRFVETDLTTNPYDVLDGEGVEE